MPRPLREIVHPSWALALEPVEDVVREVGQQLRQDLAQGRGYLPPRADVLRVFTFPLPEVRVLIVGQDPYPTPGHAVGLSFSVAAEVSPIPRSLKNIFTELESDLGIPAPLHGDLSQWAHRGVMLLNRVLTVSPGQAGSHRGRGWEKVTDCAIAALAATEQPLVAILWGRDAASLTPKLGRIPTIESPHPSPLSAHRGFFGSRPFSRANAHLREQGGSAVDWSLTVESGPEPTG